MLANWTIDELNLYLQKSTKFVKISWTIININEIKFVEPYKPNDIEMFIATQNDPSVQKELQKIYSERNAKDLKTDWPKHLRSIYETRKK